MNLDPNKFDNIRVWFNNKGWAASVAYMNAINNVVLRSEIHVTYIIRVGPYVLS